MPRSHQILPADQNRLSHPAALDGLAPPELVTLRWEAVDFAHGQIWRQVVGRRSYVGGCYSFSWNASLGVATTAIEAIARERVASHLKVVK